MIYHHMLNEHSTQRSLDYLSRAYSGLGGYKETFKHDWENLRSAPLEGLARYNGTDAEIPLRIVAKLREQLAANEALSRPLEELMRRVSPFVATMEAAGLAVDHGRLQEVEGDLIDQKEAALHALRMLAPNVNPDSTPQLSDYLFKDLGIPLPEIKDLYGKSGKPSTREEVLKLLPNSPYIDALLEYRGLQKLLRTYVKQLREYSSSLGVFAGTNVSGVRPEYFLAKTDWGGTVTGRLSCKKPAMQTIPKDTSLRSVFVPRYRTGTLFGLDADQMELRIAAQLSGDPTLTEVFQRGLDPHLATADLCNVTRSEGKTINFASIYGASTPKLVELGLKLRTAQRAAKTLRTEWATLYQFFSEVKAEAMKTGEVRTDYGRIRRLPGATTVTPKGRALLREAANFVIQAPASDIVQLLGWHMMLELEGLALPILSNHDGLLFDVYAKEELGAVLAIAQQCTAELPTYVEETLGLKLTVPIDFSYEAGNNWHTLKEIN
jgi:DNA polymerase-1